MTEDDRVMVYHLCETLCTMEMISIEELVQVAEKTMGKSHAQLTKVLYESAKMLRQLNAGRWSV